MCFTATCGDCDKAWRGANALSHGEEHEKATEHVVWYDEDDEDGNQTDRVGTVTWEPEGGVLQAGIFHEDNNDAL